jgi:hypothetical protein
MPPKRRVLPYSTHGMGVCLAKWPSFISSVKSTSVLILNANISMLCSYVIVYLVTGRDAQAHPAEVRRAATACHVVTSVSLFNWCLALWTRLVHIVFQPFLEVDNPCQGPFLVFRAA